MDKQTKINYMIRELVIRQCFAPGAPMFPEREGYGVMEFSTAQREQQWRDWFNETEAPPVES